jgi:hypothetical protein
MEHMGLAVGHSGEDVAYGSAADAYRAENRTELPVAGLRYAVSDATESLYAQTVRVAGLNRLSHIRQLSYIHLPIKRDYFGVAHAAPTFPHTRFQHSCDVMAIAALIGERIGLDAQDMRTIKVAALTHDVFTVAGGDAIKDIDPLALDEDAAYPKLFERPDWPEFERTFGLDRALLTSIIRNEGPLGQLLDWADKIGYVARDLTEYRLLAHRASSCLERVRDLDAYVLFQSRVCRIWESLVLRDGVIACTDPDALAEFLRARVILFRDLYYGERTQFLRTFVRCVVGFLLARGTLQHADLFEKNDMWLNHQILQQTDVYCGGAFTSSSLGQPAVHRYRTMGEAYRAANDYFSAYKDSIVAVCERRLLNPRLDLPVVVHGAVRPFMEACPDKAKHISDLTRTETPILLFVLRNNTSLDVSFLKEYRRTCTSFDLIPPLASP